MESLENYLEALASSAPTPGGGSAATIVGAMGAALVAMVARITSENAKFVERKPEIVAIQRRADDLRGEFLAARCEDERAYGAVVEAMALPKNDEIEKHKRARALQKALAEAAAAPLKTCELACSLMTLCLGAQALKNAHLMSDVDCAAYFSRAAIESARANVRVNHRLMKDAGVVAFQAAELARDERLFNERYDRFMETKAS